MPKPKHPITRARGGFIVPKHLVAKLGKGDHAGGAQLLDGFLGTAPAEIDWPKGEDGDYVIRQKT